MNGKYLEEDFVAHHLLAVTSLLHALKFIDTQRQAATRRAKSGGDNIFYLRITDLLDRNIRHSLPRQSTIAVTGSGSVNKK